MCIRDRDAGTDEAAQRQGLKTKLSNIAATAQVKRDYVDKFAAVLTAEQIRRLYNTEGEIGTNIKRAAVDRRRNQNTRLKGSGRMVTQDWGKAGDYTGISAAAFFDVTVSPTARTISVTADDNVIDYLVLERDGGTLKFRVNANNTAVSYTHLDVYKRQALARLREFRPLQKLRKPRRVVQGVGKRLSLIHIS